MARRQKLAGRRMHELAVVALAAAIAGFAASASPLAAASFDCRRAALPAEKAICGDANLSKLDEQTAGMYFVIIGSGAPDATVRQVKQMQGAFVARRNACGADIDCLVQAYTDQMMFLKNIKGDLGL